MAVVGKNACNSCSPGRYSIMPSGRYTSCKSGPSRSSSAGSKLASRWFWSGFWLCVRVAFKVPIHIPCRNFHADAAIPDEGAGAVEHRLAAHPEGLLGAIGLGTAEGEVEKGFARGDLVLQGRALCGVAAVLD